MRSSNVIVFVPRGSYAFEQQLATAEYLASRGNFWPHFLLMEQGDHQRIEQIELAGFSYSTMHPAQQTGVTSTAKQDTVVSFAERQSENVPPLHVSPGRMAYRILQLAWRLQRRKQTARKLLRPLKPYCAVISQERDIRFLPVIKALRGLGTPIILVPAADSSPDGSAWIRRNNSLFKAGVDPATPSKRLQVGIALLNRLVVRWLPSQVFASPWGRMLFFPATDVLALKSVGMLPENPWYQGTTFADYIMISGADEAAMCQEAGISSSKILPYGSHELDLLYQNWSSRDEIRQRLIHTYGLDARKHIFILSMPQLWEEGTVSKEDHWQSINDILKVLSSNDCNVLASLHPRVNPADYQWIGQEYRVRICRESLKEVIAAADVFLSAYSSTNRWAIALGIPVINLDLWQLNWSMYRGLSGYKTVTNVFELEKAVRKLAHTPDKSRHQRQLPSGDANQGIVFDGKARERLFQFLESLHGNANDVSEAITKSFPFQYNPGP